MHPLQDDSCRVIQSLSATQQILASDITGQDHIYRVDQVVRVPDILFRDQVYDRARGGELSPCAVSFDAGWALSALLGFVVSRWGDVEVALGGDSGSGGGDGGAGGGGSGAFNHDNRDQGQQHPVIAQGTANNAPPTNGQHNGVTAAAAAPAAAPQEVGTASNGHQEHDPQDPRAGQSEADITAAETLLEMANYYSDEVERDAP